MIFNIFVSYNQPLLTPMSSHQSLRLFLILFFSLFTHQVLFGLPNQNWECVLSLCMGNIARPPESCQILKTPSLVCYHVSLPSWMLWLLSYWSLTGLVHAEPTVLNSCAQFLCCFWKISFPWCFPIKEWVLHRFLFCSWY